MSLIKHDDGAWTALAVFNGAIYLAVGATRLDARNSAIAKIRSAG